MQTSLFRTLGAQSDWSETHLPMKQVILSLMNQYTPIERLRENPDFRGLCRKVTKREYEQVVQYAIELGVEDAFIQEGDTAGESYIPKFWTNNDCSE